MVKPSATQPKVTNNIEQAFRPGSNVAQDYAHEFDELVDLGLATVRYGTETNAFATMTGSIMGTAAFMPPEQNRDSA